MHIVTAVNAFDPYRIEQTICILTGTKEQKKHKLSKVMAYLAANSFIDIRVLKIK
jgi:hypothetical protein